jgi:hypothetical protein
MTMHLRTQPTTSQATVRYYGLDAARAIALFIGIFHHGIESFVSYAKWDWITQDSQQSLIIDILFYVSHVFRMQAFFLMSGFFGHLLLSRLGIWGFVINRAKRLALPLIIFWPLLYVGTYYLWVWGIIYLRDGTHQQAVSELPDYMIFSHGLPLMHLWFLYFLILYCVCAVVYLSSIKKLITRKGYSLSAVNKFVLYCSRRWWGSLLIGLFMVIPMLGMTDGFGVDTSASGLIPRIAPFVLYGAYFALGWIMFKVPNLMSSMSRFKRQNLTASIILVIVLIGVNLALMGTSSVHMGVGRGLINILYAFASISAVFAFIGYITAYFSSHSPKIRYLSDASYWGYLIHLPLVGYFQILVAPYEWFWGMKLVLIFIPVILIIFISYKYLVRTTGIGVLLNGAKKLKSNVDRSKVKVMSQ